MFYSTRKQALRPEALLPPSNRRDVSLLRRKYTTDLFCKKHSASLKIADSNYCGLAIFKAIHVKEVNNIAGLNCRVELVGSPMDENNHYRNSSLVFSNDPGLPMHSDLLYDTPMIKGEVASKFRKYASELVKRLNYFPDPAPARLSWEGPKLKWTNKGNSGGNP